jgi:hypothetical protein
MLSPAAKVHPQDAPLHFFYSHAWADKAFVEGVKSVIDEMGKTGWIDTERLSTGDSHIELILDGIQRAEVILFFISPSYLHSDNCNVEFKYAVQYCKGKKLLPILLPQVASWPPDLFKMHDNMIHPVTREPSRLIPTYAVSILAYVQGMTQLHRLVSEEEYKMPRVVAADLLALVAAGPPLPPPTTLEPPPTLGAEEQTVFTLQPLGAGVLGMTRKECGATERAALLSFCEGVRGAISGVAPGPLPAPPTILRAHYLLWTVSILGKALNLSILHRFQDVSESALCCLSTLTHWGPDVEVFKEAVLDVTPSLVLVLRVLLDSADSCGYALRILKKLFVVDPKDTLAASVKDLRELRINGHPTFVTNIVPALLPVIQKWGEDDRVCESALGLLSQLTYNSQHRKDIFVRCGVIHILGGLMKRYAASANFMERPIEQLCGVLKNLAKDFEALLEDMVPHLQTIAGAGGGKPSQLAADALTLMHYVKGEGNTWVKVKGLKVFWKRSVNAVNLFFKRAWATVAPRKSRQPWRS